MPEGGLQASHLAHGGKAKRSGRTAPWKDKNDSEYPDLNWGPLAP